MRTEYKHPAPYRPDFDYKGGMNAADKHIKEITKQGTHPGQAQHLGGMASYRNHLEEAHYGKCEKIKKDLKGVLDYLFYYSKTDHDIYHFLAEDALMHIDQMVSDIEDPKEKEHIRYFAECVREYMHWLKADRRHGRRPDEDRTDAYGFEQYMNENKKMNPEYRTNNETRNEIGFDPYRMDDRSRNMPRMEGNYKFYPMIDRQGVPGTGTRNEHDIEYRQGGQGGGTRNEHDIEYRRGGQGGQGQGTGTRNEHDIEYRLNPDGTRMNVEYQRDPDRTDPYGVNPNDQRSTNPNYRPNPDRKDGYDPNNPSRVNL